MKLKKAFIPLLLVPASGAMAEHEPTHLLDEMIITTSHKLFPNTTKATTSFDITAEDISKTNLLSASDVIKNAPSVHVRRRFIGDTNGVTAIRGSTNFQTAHFNMFLDGIPLHNPVQTKWNGAPKWSLIAPNSVDSATVFYGPFSAEHRPAFGGTFDLKTRLPEEFEMHMDVTGIIQQSHRFGQEEVLTGHKEFISAGDRIGDFTISGFYNHLENEGQAQSVISTTEGSKLVATSAADTVTGAYWGQPDVNGKTRVITGDRGLNINTTDLYSAKVAYDINPDLRAQFTVAFEDTERTSTGRSYLKDLSGNTLVSGKAISNGYEFDVNPTSWGNPSLRNSDNQRETLMYGLNLSGKVNEDWDIDTTASFFDAYKDRSIQDNLNGKGLISETTVWWADYSAKMATQSLFGNDDIGFMAGGQFNNSYLNFQQFGSDNIASETRDSFKDHDGGSTTTYSAFMQTDWWALDDLNVMAGVRYDHWASSRGRLNKEALEDRDLSRVSPKFHISYNPVSDLNLKYSFSKAYRMPIAEELFDSSSNADVVNLSDPTLAPESGFFHDISLKYDLPEGYIRTTFFYNNIEDEIMRISTALENGKTSNRIRNIDESETLGIELVYNQDNILGLPFGLNANGTWLNKEIKKDSNGGELVDKEWLRIPKYRAHVVGTYHATEDWDVITEVNYRSQQFANADNSDKKSDVFGSTNSHVLVNFKTAYSMDVSNDMTAKFSVGVDNILDEDVYDHHPYPQRTYFANVSLDI